MTPLERVMATLQGKPADRVPVIAVLSAYGSRLTGVPLKEYFTDPRAYADGQGAVMEQLEADALLAPFVYGYLCEAFGGELRWFDNQAPNVRKPPFESLSEALQAPLPDCRTTGHLPFILEAVRIMKERYGERIPLFSPIPGPAGLAALTLGLEGFLDAFLFHPEQADRLLDRYGHFFTEWGNALFEAGVAGLIMTEPLSASEVAPRKMFEKRVCPRLEKLLPCLNGPVVFHHSGGHLNHVLDLAAALSGVIGASVSSKDDLAEARKLLGPDKLLLGNLDNLTFPEVSAERIRRESLVRLEQAAGHGPFILATSGADLPLSTPPENILAMVRASKDFAAGERVTGDNITWLGCGVLRQELEELHRQGLIGGRLIFLDSMLHMVPDKLDGILGRIVAKRKPDDPPLVMVHGDCCPGMLQLADTPGVARVNAINCVRMLLGPERYRQLMREEAFLLLYEWARRWQEIMTVELGLTPEVGQSLMREHRSVIVYLDTGLHPVPEADINACADYAGLPWRIEKVTLEPLLALLREAGEKACNGGRT